MTNTKNTLVFEDLQDGSQQKSVAFMAHDVAVR